MMQKTKIFKTLKEWKDSFLAYGSGALDSTLGSEGLTGQATPAWVN